jgi:CBS domain-containing protein
MREHTTTARPAPHEPVRLIMKRPMGIDPEVSLLAVARELVDGEIGVLLVETPGGPVGVVSERDLVTVVAVDGELPDEQAADLMTTDLVTAGPGDSIAAVGRLMVDAGVRHIPVLDGSTVVGLVSMRDVLAVLLPDGS